MSAFIAGSMARCRAKYAAGKRGNASVPARTVKASLFYKQARHGARLPQVYVGTAKVQ